LLFFIPHPAPPDLSTLSLHDALPIFDFIRAYTDPGSPLYAPAVVKAVNSTVPLLEAARRKGVPVVYTRVLYHASGADDGNALPADRKSTRLNSSTWPPRMPSSAVHKK